MIVPSPSILRINPVTKAIITAGTGPNSIATITLIACCTGYAFATPAGNQSNWEPIVAIATKTAIVVISLVRFTLYSPFSAICVISLEISTLYTTSCLLVLAVLLQLAQRPLLG